VTDDVIDFPETIHRHPHTGAIAGGEPVEAFDVRDGQLRLRHGISSLPQHSHYWPLTDTAFCKTCGMFDVDTKTCRSVDCALRRLERLMDKVR
jgi:hypothetical protein